MNWKIKRKKIKNLFEDNSNFQVILDDRTSEVSSLQQQIDSYVETNSKLIEEKINLERITSDLNSQVKHLDLKLVKLTEDNFNLNKVCEEQERKIDRLNRDFSITKEENSSGYKNQMYLEKRLADLQAEVDDLFAENNQIQRTLKIKDSEVEVGQDKQDKMFDDNSRLYDEVQRLKNHLNVLTDQNRILEDKLEMVKDQDQIIKSHLQRRNMINDVVHENRNRITNSYHTLEN